MVFCNCSSVPSKNNQAVMGGRDVDDEEAWVWVGKGWVVVSLWKCGK